MKGGTTEARREEYDNEGSDESKQDKKEEVLCELERSKDSGEPVSKQTSAESMTKGENSRKAGLGQQTLQAAACQNSPFEEYVLSGGNLNGKQVNWCRRRLVCSS